MNLKRRTAEKNQTPRSGNRNLSLSTSHLLPVIILALVSLLVYFNSLTNGFVYDDYETIVENKYIQHPWKSLPSLFSRSYFNIASGEASYRPVATLSYFLIYSIAELNATYYHLFSVLLHAFNVVLVYLLGAKIIRNRYSALIAGLLFACHPALTEAVDAISYNEDLLAAAFFLLAFLGYTGLDTREVKSCLTVYGLSVFSFLLALLSKEMAITLPAIIFLYDLAIREIDGDGRPFTFELILHTVKNRLYFYAGYLAVSLFYLYLRFGAFYHPGESIKPFYGSLIERIIYLPAHIFSFIKLAVFPADLNAEYVFSYPGGFFETKNLIGLVVVLGLVGAGYISYKRSKPIFFGIWWFLICLSPVYNLIPLFNPFADRYLYIPLVGFCVAVAVVLNDVLNSRFYRAGKFTRLTPILVIIILGLYSAGTIVRNRDWKDGLTLWSKTVKSSPGSSIAHGSLGHAYQDLGRLEEAVEEYKRAIAINQDDYKAHYNLGTVYDQQGRLDLSIGSYQRSILANPAYANAHFNIGIIYQKLGQLDKAIGHFSKVTELDPADYEARNNLGVAFAIQGNLDRAIAEWHKVQEIDPQNQSARENILKAKKMMNKDD
jgi:tetratricopeptide (TPR) repeat protein